MAAASKLRIARPEQAYIIRRRLKAARQAGPQRAAAAQPGGTYVVRYAPNRGNPDGRRDLEALAHETGVSSASALHSFWIES